MNPIAIYIFIFIFGAIIGSFLNVIILRYNTGKSIVNGNSACLACGSKLRWYELIPIASFFAQKGRCRGCKSKISRQYPLVELLTGLIFVIVWSHELWIGNYNTLRFPGSLFLVLGLVYFWTIFSVLIIIAVYDIRHQIIPDKFVYLFIFLSAFAVFFDSSHMGLSGIWRSVFSISGLPIRLLSGIIFFSFFGLLWLASHGRAMGLGDAKLALGIGLLLGFSKGLSAILFSFWSGAFVGILLLILAKKRYNLKSKIAFGPFLAFGSIVAFWVGNIVIIHII